MATNIVVIFKKTSAKVKEYFQNYLVKQLMEFGKMMYYKWVNNVSKMVFTLDHSTRNFNHLVKEFFNMKQMVIFIREIGKMDCKMAGEHLRMIRVIMLVYGEKAKKLKAH
jgi:hypothetical protein